MNRIAAHSVPGVRDLPRFRIRLLLPPKLPSAIRSSLALGGTTFSRYASSSCPPAFRRMSLPKRWLFCSPQAADRRSRVRRYRRRDHPRLHRPVRRPHRRPQRCRHLPLRSRPIHHRSTPPSTLSPSPPMAAPASPPVSRQAHQGHRQPHRGQARHPRRRHSRHRPYACPICASLMLQHKPASLKIATCLDKPERRLVPIEADYVCLQNPQPFRHRLRHGLRRTLSGRRRHSPNARKSSRTLIGRGLLHISYAACDVVKRS